LTREKSASTVEKHLAAIRMCFDWPTGGGNLEKARAIADHESPKSTEPCDRAGDRITLDEAGRLVI
jgi:hypothetical protein